MATRHDRCAGSALERRTAFPAQLEIRWVLLAAGSAKHAILHQRRCFEIGDHGNRPGFIGGVLEPNLGIGFAKGNLAHATLGVFVEDADDNARMAQQTGQEMGLGQIRRLVDTDQDGCPTALKPRMNTNIHE